MTSMSATGRPARRRRLPLLVVLAAALAAAAPASAQTSTPAATPPSAADATAPSAPSVPSTPAAADAATPATSAAAATSSGADHPQTYFDFAVAGGALMAPIGLLSVLLVAFLIERLLVTRRSRVLPRPLVQEIEAAIAARPADRDRAAKACAAHASCAARILAAAVSRLDLEREEIEHAVNSVAQREVFTLRRFTRLFSIIAGVAPLLGLLGTVTGMIQAFREVAIQGLGSGGQALAPGIYQALITTAAGLIVAIPALISYHWLNARIDGAVHAIDRLAVDLVDATRGQEPR